jgi:toxin FitB
VIIVDTNVISELMRPAPERYVLSWIGEQDAEELHVTAITLAEIAYGVERLPGGRRKAVIRSTAQEAITAFRGRAIPFDEAAVPHYARIASEREHAGRPMDAFDGQIAAICAALDAALATRNTEDFDGTGITVINPWRIA